MGHMQTPPGPQTLPGVANIIAVGSGKGGVGKTTLAVNLAAALVKMGFRVGLIDADIYGPNVPLMMGICSAAAGTRKQSDRAVGLPWRQTYFGRIHLSRR